jgi:hypothetical protein
MVLDVCALALCTAAAGPDLSFAEPASQPATNSAEAPAARDLEDAFWLCDYVGTMHGAHAAPVAFCSAVTTRLQQEKFADDYGQFLAWWRQNKPAEHARFRSAEMTEARDAERTSAPARNSELRVLRSAVAL